MCTKLTALKIFNVSYWSGKDNYVVLIFNSFLVCTVRGGVSSGNSGGHQWDVIRRLKKRMLVVRFPKCQKFTTFTKLTTMKYFVVSFTLFS